MNHQCDYCHKDIQRLMFCNHSHQVMYHRGKRKTLEVIKTPIEAVQKVKQVFNVCKHGAMIGLCKHGCL